MNGRAYLRRLSVHVYRAGVHPLGARENLDERGFARSVLTEENVNLRGSQSETDPLESMDAGKGLVDVFHEQQSVAVSFAHRFLLSLTLTEAHAEDSLAGEDPAVSIEPPFIRPAHAHVSRALMDEFAELI